MKKFEKRNKDQCLKIVPEIQKFYWDFWRQILKLRMLPQKLYQDAQNLR